MIDLKYFSSEIPSDRRDEEVVYSIYITLQLLHATWLENVSILLIQESINKLKPSSKSVLKMLALFEALSNN